jgi:hypothetical protein
VRTSAETNDGPASRSSVTANNVIDIRLPSPLGVPPPCEERERLTRAYHDAALKVQEAGSAISDMTSAKWKEATSQARQDSKRALLDLNDHRKAHGC